MNVFDFFDTVSSQNSATAREDAMQSLVLHATFDRVRTHTALADDQLHTGLFDKFLFVLFHTHGRRRTDGNGLVTATGLFTRHHDRTGVENGLTVQINRQLTALCDQTRVSAVTSRDQVTVQINNITDLDIFEVFGLDRRG